jgi:hypothetical protein
MLPSLRNRRPITLQTGRVDKSPWYDIWLFKTRLRFRNPRRFGRLPKGLIYVDRDERPFLNTERKDQYYHAQGKYSLIEIYKGYWPLGPRKWLSAPKAVLELNLRAVDVWKEQVDQFPDLYNDAIGLAWVNQLYNHFMNDPGMVTFVSQGDGLFEIVFNDEDATPVAVEERNFEIETLNANGHKAYRLNPEPHKLDFVVPFSTTEAACFSFTLKALKALSKDESAATLKAASEFAHAIMHSVRLEYPHQSARQSQRRVQTAAT